MIKISLLLIGVFVLLLPATYGGTESRGDGLESVEKWLAEHADANLHRLIDFLSIPSVSADPHRASQVRRCAKWLAKDLVDVGMENIEVVETGGHPVVYADWMHAEGTDAPTVLIYGHYDVQPEDPVDLWTSPPFEPEVRRGRLYARGASDDKGNMYVPLMAIQAYLKTHRRLPVNVKLLLEGEEEVGSMNLKRLLEQQAKMFAADYAYSADGGMISPTIPGLVLSLRGSLCYTIKLRTANRDLHSGLFGGGVQNPIHALASLLGTLHDMKTGKILVDGYYDEVDIITKEQREEMAKQPISLQEVLTENGVNASVGEDGYSYWERVATRPTIEIVGMWGGYQGEGIKTVLPCEAFAKIACRTVSSQDPVRTDRLLMQHLKREAAKIPGVALEIEAEPNQDGTAVKVDRTGLGMQAAKRVLSELYGMEPSYRWGGGTIGAVSMIKQVLGLDTTLFGFANPDELAHSPNEFGRLASYRRGEMAYVRLLSEIARSHRKNETTDSAKEEL